MSINSTIVTNKNEQPYHPQMKLPSNKLLTEAEVISEMQVWGSIDHAGPTFDNNEMSVLFLGSNHPTEVADLSIEEKYSTYHSNTYSSATYYHFV
jgi:hypothetical protein